jgi:tRNA(His) 5'-end guanylyltransferase
MWSIVRVDGRGFSRFTAEVFDKPFDPRVHDCMADAATALVEEYTSPYGYTQSDEISLVLPPAYDGFGRSLEKLVSISAGIASAAFTLASGMPRTSTPGSGSAQPSMTWSTTWPGVRRTPLARR